MTDTRHPVARRPLWTTLLGGCIVAAGGLDLSAQSVGSAPDTRLSSRAGIYTAAQAERGRDAYAMHCRSCHTPEYHSSPAFVASWDGRTVGDLIEYLRDNMPQGEPGSLTREEYLWVTAYLLRLNGMPPGREALRADPALLHRIRLDLKPADPPHSSRTSPP